MEDRLDEKKFCGFTADPDVMVAIKRQNDKVYETTGRSNQTIAINELIRIAAKSMGWKLDVPNV